MNTDKHEPKKLNDGAYEHDMAESHKVGTTLGRGLSTMLVTKMLQLSDEAIEEIHKVDEYNFDIFKLR